MATVRPRRLAPHRTRRAPDPRGRRRRSGEGAVVVAPSSAAPTRLPMVAVTRASSIRIGRQEAPTITTFAPVMTPWDAGPRRGAGPVCGRREPREIGRLASAFASGMSVVELEPGETTDRRSPTGPGPRSATRRRSPGRAVRRARSRQSRSSTSTRAPTGRSSRRSRPGGLPPASPRCPRRDRSQTLDRLPSRALRRLSRCPAPRTGGRTGSRPVGMRRRAHGGSRCGHGQRHRCRRGGPRATPGPRAALIPAIMWLASIDMAVAIGRPMQRMGVTGRIGVSASLLDAGIVMPRMAVVVTTDGSFRAGPAPVGPAVDADVRIVRRPFVIDALEGATGSSGSASMRSSPPCPRHGWTRRRAEADRHGPGRRARMGSACARGSLRGGAAPQGATGRRTRQAGPSVGAGRSP